MSFQRLSTITIFPNAVVLAKTLLGNLTTIVLKTRPDRPVRPVQPGTGSQSSPVKTPKTSQQPVKNMAKTGVELEIKKKTIQCPVRFLKPCLQPKMLHQGNEDPIVPHIIL